jgi:hypothetical protein
MAQASPTTHGKPRLRFDDMPLPQQAGIIANDERFRAFVGERITTTGTTVSASAAAEFIRTFCGIRSRKHLPYDDAAQRKFATLRTEFDAWTGKIATPETGR